jgi:hypothetical protein
LPKFTGSTTIGNSVIQDSGTLVTVGVAATFSSTLQATHIGINNAPTLARLFATQTTNGEWIATFKNYGGSASYGVSIDMSGSTSDQSAFQVYTSTGNGLRLVNNSRLLIGTFTDSGYQLDVNGTGRFSDGLTATSNSSLFKEGFRINATTTGGPGSQPAYTYYTAAGSKRWSHFLNVGDDKFHIANASNSELFTIQQNGSVGIGTTTPFGLASSLLAIVGSGTTYNLLNIQDTVNQNNAAFIQFINSAGSGIGGITRVGTTNAVLYSTTSDYRLKEDLQEIKGLEVLSAIKVYNYKWKDHESRMDGVLAHELAEVLPYAVYGKKDEIDQNGNDKMQGVDYGKIVPIIVKAIQEQQEIINYLKQKIS